MEWKVLAYPDFEEWLLEQDAKLRVVIAAHVKLLMERGPLLGRPYVDTLHDNDMDNLKELRVQHRGKPWRILFAFDPRRQAILLVGGCKEGDDRWYEKIIPLAKERYKQHLKELEDHNG
jgi:hypothetical protein